MELTLDLKNYDKTDTIYERTAARALIRRGTEYLFVYSIYGDCKFSGGGVEIGESIQDVLVREVQEETGFRVLDDTISLYGTVSERRKGYLKDILEMDSHYFFTIG
jgi:8-oxo-dGTP pyrophosphatase MutT (NUDIX family)